MLKSIVEQIFDFSYICPNKIALTDGKNSVTYKQLVNNILFTKNILEEEFGLKKKDCVILAANKELNFVSIYFAAHLIGIIVVPIDPETNENRFNIIYNKIKPKLIIGFKNLTKCKQYDFSFFQNYDTEKVYSSEIFFPNEDNVADIIFTTGTTGTPKGVVLTQKNISAAANNINSFINNTTDNVELLALPISHSFGLGRLRCVLSNGQTLVLLGSFANIKRFFRFIEEYKVNGFGMVPASWSLIKKLSGNKISDYSSQLTYIEIGSAPMQLEDKELLIRLLPKTNICMHYGLTEASRSSFINFNLEKDFLNTVGKASPNMNITIRNDFGEVLPDNVQGEICVEGDAVTRGYYKDKNKTKESFWGNSFRTGDWGEKNFEGYIILASRKKELINIGGKKVSPIEVETVLKSIEFIQDCACIAIPDPNKILGEVIKAFVVSSAKEKINYETITPLISSKLEKYKLPVEYECIDEIPKTKSGKIQRLLLK